VGEEWGNIDAAFTKKAEILKRFLQASHRNKHTCYHFVLLPPDFHATNDFTPHRPRRLAMAAEKHFGRLPVPLIMGLST
jgi:hypothetical protein